MQKQNYSYFVKNNILVLEKGEGLNHQKATAYYFNTKNLKVEKVTSNHKKVAGFLIGIDKNRLKRQVTAMSDFLWVEFHHRKDKMYFNIIDHDAVKHEFIQLNHLDMVVEAIENHFLDKRKYISPKVKKKYYPYIRKYLTGNKRYFEGNLVTNKVNKMLNSYSESQVGKALEQKHRQIQDNYALAPVEKQVVASKPIRPIKQNNQAIYEAERILGYRERGDGELKAIEHKRPKNKALNSTLFVVDVLDKVIQTIGDILIPFGKKR